MGVKGITWVGDVYEKFEAMCLEVEEIMYEDTVKYVENQVQTVGESVKKFYSDVMQDLLPESSLDPEDPEKTSLDGLDLGKISDDENDKSPNFSKKGAGNVDLEQSSGDILCNKDNFFQSSRDSAKGECSDLSLRLNCYKSLSNCSNLGARVNLNKERFPLGAKSCKIIPIKQNSSRALCDFFNEASCDQVVTTTTLFAREDTMCDPVAGSFNGIERRSECRALMSTDYLPSNMLDSVKSVENEANEIRVSSSGGGSAELNDYNLSNEVACLREISHKEEEQHKYNAEEKMFVSHPERSSESSSDAACANVVAINGLGTNEQTDSAKLEETCVMVHEDELQLLPNREVKRRTYKKKIRGAFTSIRKSARKQEYEQLAAWFGDEAKLEQQCGKSLTATTSKDLQKLTNDDSCESEWELL